MLSYLLWSVIPPLWRIQKELPPPFLSLTDRDRRKTPFQMIQFDHTEATLRFCVLHRRCPIFRFASDDFQVKIFRQINQAQVLWEEVSRQTRGDEQHKKAYNCSDLWVPPLFLSRPLWDEEVHCSAKFADWWRAVASAHRHAAASSSSWLTSLFSMRCCFCGLEKSYILHIAIELGALIMNKTLLRCKNTTWQLHLLLLTVQAHPM
jgi:hypothetical protein